MQIFSQNSILSKRLDKMKGVLKMYNVKISQYLESTEVVYYSNVITGREKEKDSFIVERDNELFEVYSFMAFGINKSEKSKEKMYFIRSLFHLTAQKIKFIVMRGIISGNGFLHLLSIQNWLIHLTMMK